MNVSRSRHTDSCHCQDDPGQYCSVGRHGAMEHGQGMNPAQERRLGSGTHIIRSGSLMYWV